jgi:glycosyltransferase involved in cell wall biosynthesis
MKILFISNVFPSPYLPTKGPFNFELVRALAREHEVRVIAPIGWADEWCARRNGAPSLNGGRCARVDGIEVHYPRYYYLPRVLRRFYGHFLWHSVRPVIQRLLQEQRPDAVVGYWVHPDGAVAVRAARLAGVPAIVMTGGSDILLLTRSSGRRRCILNVLHQADVIATASQDLKVNLTGLGISPNKLHVVPRGVDTERFCPGDRAAARRRLGIAPHERALLWVGRMVPVKGLNVLVEACARLRAAGEDFHLYLVGDGPLRAGLEAECQARGLAQTVSFVGKVLHEHLPDWYRAVDRTVLPSLSEGIPNVLRESLACGTPFVASRVGGVPEITTGPHNQLVPPDDAPALAEALRCALSQPAPAEEPNGCSSSWEESAEQLLRVLRPLVGAVPEAVPS